MSVMAASPDAASTTVYLARHGQSEWNNQSRITGQADIGLSARGRQQSLSLAEALRDARLDAVYASALRRAIATAQPTATAHALPVNSLAELNEIHMGILQGRQRDETDPDAQALWAQWQANLWGPPVPGGESFGEFAGRVGGALQSILERHRGGHVLIVGHRATNRVLLGTLLGWPRERWSELRLRNKFFYRIRTGEVSQIATCTLSSGKMGTFNEGFVM